ncbi:phosphate/phosphite/phosphonate ABC transporter, periplasmic binding protein [Desulfuromonas soudanensis]|uniref:Phosphate/phosphite/phosphonate ABC transporter, periplasmic binding protein n=1 Tax=Desulfuromonas soudanensis TaxID=1603606 RepID=A0A0M4DAU3_9BACT|nr:phosphate/phosphite/phosphonate ABC transporter substrate-binding protein [Desulfuromonas soudanensis]ALC17342.1 phosphate/phosphite/phosphonate ABC transporter, periplasmic binding protein [Desulfuromonas soudanensis]
MKSTGLGLITSRLAVLVLFLTVLAGCEEKPAFVSLKEQHPLPEQAVLPDDPVLNICVGSMITPQEGYHYYRQLLDHIADRMGVRVRAIDPGSYTEVNRMLAEGEVDAAFVCGGPYVEGHKSFGLELIAAPLINGEASYYSNLIVPADSPARTLEDLRGKTFAFTDPLSNSGMLVPASELDKLGESPETFFSSFLYTYAHDRSIQAVADQMVDGAAVDSLIWDFLLASHPELAKKVRVIVRFGPYGTPPVVTRPDLDPATKARLQEVLLNTHLHRQGKAILQGMHIERFVAIEDFRYDSIRELHQRFHRKAPSLRENRP